MEGPGAAVAQITERFERERLRSQVERLGALLTKQGSNPTRKHAAGLIAGEGRQADQGLDLDRPGDRQDRPAPCQEPAVNQPCGGV